MSTQSAIQGILSPKMVKSGSGYKASVDIVNVDTINCNTITSPVSFTGNNVGIITIPKSKTNPDVFNKSASIDVPNITSNSIVMLTPKCDLNGNSFFVMTDNNTITVNITQPDITQDHIFNYFVVKY